MLRDLAEAIYLNKARNIKDAFLAGARQDLLPHATIIHPPTITAGYKNNKIRPFASPTIGFKQKVYNIRI